MRRIIALALTTVVLASCGGDASRMRGVVVDLDGDLTSVASFDVLTPDGQRSTFVPGPSLETFRHGAPLSHLGEHLRSGEPIRVTYAESKGGELIAEIVEDAG